MKSRIDGQVFWRCQQCQSSVTTLSAFTRLCGEESLSSFDEAPRELEQRKGKPCCCCERPMAEVYPFDGPDAQLLDFCPDCHFIGFDAKEWFKTYASFKESGQAASYMELQSTGGKVLEVETSKRRRERELYWKEFRAKAKASEKFEVEYSPNEARYPLRLLTLLRFPMEEWQPELRNRPYVTWLLSVVIIVVSVMGFQDWEHVRVNYAFIPADFLTRDWWRSLASFFFHGDYFHLFGNLYFFLVFGDNVEDYLGKLRFLLLLACGAFVGAVAHWATDPSSMIPTIGASDGISAVIVFYALQFPKARVAIAPPIITPLISLVWLIRLKIGWALLLWFGVQGFYLLLQLNGLSNISAAAHLGGALAGAIIWKLWRMRVL